MEHNNLGASSAARILVVFEGVLGFITSEGEAGWHPAALAGDWRTAARCWTLSELALAKLTDLCRRQSINVEVVTYVGPQEFADELEKILVDEEMVPIRRVISSTPDRTARRATFAQDVAAVYDPEPMRSMAYGGKGRHISSIHQIGS